MKQQYLNNGYFALPKGVNFNYLCKKAMPLEESNCKHLTLEFNAQSAIFSILAIILLFSFITTPLYAETGKASFYGNGEKLNTHTANREVFNPQALTAATYRYPFNTILKVTNLKNHKFVIVRVNDRGPNKRLGRAIDLTKQAFSQIASLDKGIIEVKIEEVN